MIELKFGSIFDDKCDLLIIPCNSAGGVTSWVFENLKNNSLQTPKNYIPFGKVDYQKTNFKLENAEYIGFAASVDTKDNHSDIEAIKSISDDIINFCSNKSIKKINIPILGTGAGRLSNYTVFELYIKVFGELELDISIYTPSRETYDNLFSAFDEYAKKTKKIKIKNPRVFISYAGDDKENAKWVKNLATRLRLNGIEARLDKFHLNAGVDLPQWMTNELIMADKVILVCDYNYMVKADVRKGGVGWETMIIQGDMLSHGETKTKYIALVRESEIDKALPIYMKSKLAINWGKKNEINEEEFKELLLTLFDCDIEPELGEIPNFIKQSLKVK